MTWREKGLENQMSRSLIIFASLLCVSAMTVGCALDTTPSPQEQLKAVEAKCSDRVTAYVMSQEFIRRKLKAPSTAKFPLITDPEVNLKYLGDCTHEVKAYVDAQNSFGAMIRSRYYIKVRNQKGTGTWDASDTKIE